MINPSEIEDAVISQIKSQMPYLKTVDALANLLADDSPDYAIIAPAVFVAYGSGSYRRVGTSSVFDRDMKVNVVIVQRNFIGQKRLLHGDAINRGIYDILEDVRAALTDQTCGLSIFPLTPVDDQGLEATRDVVVWGLSFHTRARG
jgi:phage gp37-like protein